MQGCQFYRRLIRLADKYLIFAVGLLQCCHWQSNLESAIFFLFIFIFLLAVCTDPVSTSSTGMRNPDQERKRDNPPKKKAGK